MELALPIIHVPHDISPFSRMSQALSNISDNSDKKRVFRESSGDVSKRETFFNLKCKLVTVVAELPPKFHEMAHSLHFELSNVHISNRTPQHNETIIHAEFQSLIVHILSHKSESFFLRYPKKRLRCHG